MANDKVIWDFLKDKGLNDYAIAGVMGNLRAESALNPKNLQQTYEKKLGHTDDSYTAGVDNGSYTNFVKDSAGYGLAQWTYWSRKQSLLNYAKAAKKSIGDLDMQLNFLWQELQGYKGVMQVLKCATSVLEASNVVLMQYERPADMGAAVQSRRANYGQQYYDKYASICSPSVPTPKPTPEPPASYKVGDVVTFIGNKHYVSANADSGKACKAGKAKITQIYQLGKSKHPYHLIREVGGGSNVYGWVDAADIKSVCTARVHKVVKGDNLTQISKRYGTTINAIVVANKKKYPNITANYIVVGWELEV